MQVRAALLSFILYCEADFCVLCGYVWLAKYINGNMGYSVGGKGVQEEKATHHAYFMTF